MHEGVFNIKLLLQHRAVFTQPFILHEKPQPFSFIWMGKCITQWGMAPGGSVKIRLDLVPLFRQPNSVIQVVHWPMICMQARILGGLACNVNTAFLLFTSRLSKPKIKQFLLRQLSRFSRDPSMFSTKHIKYTTSVLLQSSIVNLLRWGLCRA